MTALEPMDWRPRAARLARIVAGAHIAASFPLLQVVRLRSEQFTRLEGAVIAYLWQSLCAAFPERSFSIEKVLIESEAPMLLALPNRTPNGVVLPRRDTFLAFNIVHQALAWAVESACLLPAFSHLQIPCNVRLVEGTPDQLTDARSYSSTKIHTDVWNGEPISSILFNIPVLGDTEGVDLRFYEPRAFPEALRVPLRDYRLGEPVATSADEYLTPFEMGCMYISDSLSLHRTVKRKPRLRVSLDFRAIARELLPGEMAESSDSRATYVAPATWRDCGSAVILGSGEPLDGFKRRQAGEVVKRQPPSIIDMDETPPAISLRT